MALVVAVVVVPVAAVVAPAPAGAAPSSFSLAMVSGTGVVDLPRIDAPLELRDPTALSGTLDGDFDGTGAITGVQLATPDVHFVTEQQGFTVNVDAVFSQTAGGTGVVVTQDDGRASVALDISVVLTLELDIGGALFQTCVSQPIHLSLRSALDAPYDPESGRVTLSDPDFAIPVVPTTDVCISQVTAVLNPVLAGAGNAITLTLDGALDLPPAPGEPTTTTLSSAADTTSLGQPATFTATVAPGEGAEADEDPTGEVQFFVDGNVSLGRSTLDEDGEATLATATLPAGSHQVTARYLGDAVFSPSQSAPLAHMVAAVPTLTAPFPTQIVVGAPAQEFTATVTNPASGSPQANLRLDVRFGNLVGLLNGNLVLEHLDTTVSPAAWQPIALTGSTTQTGSYGGQAGFALAAGASREIRLRIAAPAGARQGPLPVRIQVNAVDPDDGEVVATLDGKEATSAIVPSARRSTSITMGTPPSAPNPPVARQGYSVGFQAVVARGGGSPYPTMAGTRLEIYVDGVPAPSMPRGDFGDTQATLERVPPDASSGSSLVDLYLPRGLTRTLAPGTHTVQVRLHGDGLWASAVSPEVTFTVLTQPTTAPYSCFTVAPIGNLFAGARLEVLGDVAPVAVSGGAVPVGRMSIRIVLEGPPGSVAGLTGLFGADPDREATITLASQNNVGTFTTFTYVGPGIPANPNVEQVIEFGGATALVPISGAPGDGIDVTVNALGFRAVFASLAIEFSCIPVGGAESIGRVTVAGTTLAVDRPAVTVGDPVTLTASVFPTTAQGFVEFFDGASSLGIAPVVGGSASLRTRGLPAGDRQVVARHLGDLVQPATTSEPVTVAVRAIECPDFAEAGHGATVRLAYLELLRRCPDQAGFDFWVGRLESGTSAEAFARSISATPEAVGVVVDDAYRTMLGRGADAPGKAFWVGRMISGSGRYDQLLADLAASDEFWSLSGSTNEGFVTRVYERLLNRAPDTAGLDFWTGRLDAGASRRSLVVTLANLDEPLGVLVGDSYGQILDRAPSAPERGDGIAFLRSTGDRSGLYAELIGRPEFATRAGTFPNRD